MLWNAAIAGMTYAKYAKELMRDSTAMMKYAQKSIQIFDIIQKVYPDYENSKNTYLYRGVIYDDILEDYEKAKSEYSEYIYKHPNDSASSNLKEYLKYLGVTTNEIYQNFNIPQ
jgi:tetratricopeptide (TPR) repeat protein